MGAESSQRTSSAGRHIFKNDAIHGVSQAHFEKLSKLRYFLAQNSEFGRHIQAFGRHI